MVGPNVNHDAELETLSLATGMDHLAGTGYEGRPFYIPRSRVGCIVRLIGI